MNLYDYPGGFAPQIAPSLSRASRVWCVGGMVWLCAALFLLGLASFKMGYAPDFLASSLWASTGVLLRLGKALLVYGWGCSFLFGLGLLLTGAGCRASFEWSRAAGWGWHLCTLIGGLSLCAGAGSGVENMPYPVWLWPGLIFCALPVCLSLLRAASSLEGRRPLSVVFAVLSALWALLLMTGGYVFVFWADVTPFLASVGALAAFWGVVFVALCGFACAWGWQSREGKAAPWAVVFYGACCLFGLIGFVPLLGRAPWFPLEGEFVRMGLWFVLAILVALSFCRGKEGKKMSVWLMLVLMWTALALRYYFSDSRGGVPGRDELILIFLMAGLFGSCCFYGILRLVPRCAGRDWPCLKMLISLLAVLPLLCVVWFCLAPFITNGGKSAAVLVTEAVIQARYMSVFYLCLLGGYAFLSFWVAVVWFGGGRLAQKASLVRFCGMNLSGDEPEKGEEE